jgi:hypothetical protein
MPIIMKAPEQWEKDMWELSERKDDETLLPFPTNSELFKPSSVEAMERADLEKQDPLHPDFRTIGGFQMASRTTEADRTGDRKSRERKLDSRLFLLVKKDRDEHAWQFAQGGRDDGETMRQCAEREGREELGKNLELHFASNAPVGFR